MTIGNLIDATPWVMAPETPVKEALAVMTQYPVHCIYVVDQNTFLGVLTARDLLVNIGQRFDWHFPIASLVREVPVVYRTDLPLSPEQGEAFLEAQLAYLPVVDNQGQLVGLLGAIHLLQSLRTVPPTALSSADYGMDISWQAAIARQQLLEQQIAELTLTNVTLRQRAESYQLLEESLRLNEIALQRTQSQIEQILNAMGDVVWSIKPKSFHLLYINSAVEVVYGRYVGEFLNNQQLWQEIIHPDDRAFMEQAYATLDRTRSFDFEYRILLPDQTARWVRTRAHLVLDGEGKPLRIDGVTQDSSQRRSPQLRSVVPNDALLDPLTGLANRYLLSERIEQAYRRAQLTPPSQFALLHVDLDRFKGVNDQFGYPVGDRVLVEVARRFQALVQEGDTLARLGSDEFVLLLASIPAVDSALTIATAVQEALVSPVWVEGHAIHLGASMGIAMGEVPLETPLDTAPITGPAAVIPEAAVPTMGDRITELLRNADLAMHRAKAMGTGYCEVFELSAYESVFRSVWIEHELRQLLSRLDPTGDNNAHNVQLPDPGSQLHPTGELETHELQVYFQPILDLQQQTLRGLEALVRWHHPTFGVITPPDLILVAEESHQIQALDGWVLKTACQQLARWRQTYPALENLTVNVNLSSQHFLNPDLLPWIEQVLAASGLPGPCVRLELTETQSLACLESAQALLKALQKRGIRVCLDDFGTGYSSLSYLSALSIHSLKIDQSFIQQLLVSPASEEPLVDPTAIVKAIIELGHTLNLEMVAEGIEQPQQVEILQSFGCNLGQGNLFAPPMGSSQMTEYLQQFAQIP
jgi:diguanylate cyclase (GGDEF)-like protein